MVRSRVALPAEDAVGPSAAAVEPGAPGRVAGDAGIVIATEEANMVLLWCSVSLVSVFSVSVSPEGKLLEML